MIVIENLKHLSKERIKGAKKEYGGSWKDLTKNDLKRDIEEELADTISYLSFHEKLFNEDFKELNNDIQKLYEKIINKMFPEKGNSLLHDYNNDKQKGKII